jgi:hypothetical protein
VLVIGDPGRINNRAVWLRVITGLLIAAMTLTNAFNAAHLVELIAANAPLGSATRLLGSGAAIWLVNVIAFGLWYWDLDRGGAAARARQPDRSPAFVFPEMLHTDYAGTAWVPQFIDYLSLAFWTATAVSPTDISAIKPWAKALMMLEAAGSIALAVLVIGYAVNLL